MYTWLIVAGILLIAELLTGTFYLLMLAIAGVIAWFAMLLNFDFLAQSIVFLISASILVLFTQRLRARLKANTKPNLADNLDAGVIFTVIDWVDGVGISHYRGSQWAVVLDVPDAQTLPDGSYRITQLDGTRIRVARL